MTDDELAEIDEVRRLNAEIAAIPWQRNLGLCLATAGALTHVGAAAYTNGFDDCKNQGFETPRLAAGEYHGEGFV